MHISRTTKKVLLRFKFFTPTLSSKVLANDFKYKLNSFRKNYIRVKKEEEFKSWYFATIW